ncbi:MULTISPECIES: FAD-binding oxidoreductase [Rhizobium/Agrobacterium group]|uniref:FAD-binding oxidoreductase n=2 Tax=Neorhizobium TaxID=1525371 RepID=A0ABV0M879_9HYPH|nr:MULTISPECIES: FAD-binding oxidoreductase [Rhizobium/Agrobacterium group]MCC2610960.1 FAD-binding oxidoreductase [Neorhizobium petrolearium]WGI66180.1 FAD-binding oxidoreductase [Neorhizobium petrolearium]
MDADVIIIGAGVVGAALAYGIARKGHKVLVLDGKDRDLRAARANFGLVWVQGKGSDTPAYTDLTLQSSDLWPTFGEELAEAAGSRVDYSRRGGLAFCLSEADYKARTALIERTHNRQTEAYTEMLERPALERMLPAVTLGNAVVGASYCKLDGHTNPLQLYAALLGAVSALGGQVRFRNPVTAIKPISGGFQVDTPQGNIRARRVIVAAGLATPGLTDPLGLVVPLHAERGQILVTERLAPMLPLPASGLRQTAEGTVMIGTTNEKAFDTGVTMQSAIKLARRAQRIIPALGSVRLVRQWSGLRVLSPDKAPIYAESTRHAGLFAAVCHSGVTLAAAHAAIVGPAMAEGRLPQNLAAFSNGRFNVQKCA